MARGQPQFRCLARQAPEAHKRRKSRVVSERRGATLCELLMEFVLFRLGLRNAPSTRANIDTLGNRVHHYCGAIEL